jgi:5-methyltetrahydropteroyltriglutamate--homocysteine methyltransferase
MAMDRARGGDVPDATYDAAVSKAVDGIVDKQVALGIDVIDDGEQSKAGFIAYLNERLAGYEPFPTPLGRSRRQRDLHWADQLQRRCAAAA